MDGDFTRRQTTVGAMGVLGALVLAAVGLPWLDTMVPEFERWPDGVPYEVGCGIIMTPQAGSSLNVSYSRPGRRSARAKFLIEDSGLEYTIKIAPFDGSLDGAIAQSRRRLKRVSDIDLADGHGDAIAGTEIPAHQGTFTIGGGRRVGRYAIFLPSRQSLTVEIVAAGTVEAVNAAADAIDESFASVVVRRVS